MRIYIGKIPIETIDNIKKYYSIIFQFVLLNVYKDLLNN